MDLACPNRDEVVRSIGHCIGGELGGKIGECWDGGRVESWRLRVGGLRVRVEIWGLRGVILEEAIGLSYR